MVGFDILKKVISLDRRRAVYYIEIMGHVFKVSNVLDFSGCSSLSTMGHECCEPVSVGKPQPPIRTHSTVFKYFSRLEMPSPIKNAADYEMMIFPCETIKLVDCSKPKGYRFAEYWYRVA